MKLIIAVVLTLHNVFAYHDPDLNYHLSQVQKISNCDNGYSYAAPAVQLTTAGVKVPAPDIVSQPLVPAYQYSGSAAYSASNAASYATNAATGYSTGITYQSAPKITYQTSQPIATYQTSQPIATYQTSQPIATYQTSQPIATYQTSALASNYAQGYSSQEAHGYATSAGLSASSSTGKIVTPLATYAQAPIIAKVTAAPLFARFSLAPAKTSYVTQNLISQGSYATGSLAKQSLNSHSNVQAGGPIVSQVYAAPSAGYATAPALKAQQTQIATRLTNIAAPAVTPYSQVPLASFPQVRPRVTQYATSSISHASGPSQYFAPAFSQANAKVAQYSAAPAQYLAPAVTQYATYPGPAVVQHSSQVQHAQYAAPAVPQYSAPAVSQYAASALSYTAPAATSVTQYASAPIAHISSPAVASVSIPSTKISAAGLAVKNVHSEFLENYDAHPRYAFEYSVNDPHTGDVKQQKEERDGEVVKGQYSLVEPDGNVRTVDYIADWETGFHADVRNSKDSQH